MFKIDGDTINITRGDKGVIELTIEGYTFAAGDTIEFRVYERKGLDKLPVLTKEIEVKKEGTSVDLELTAEDTKIGDIKNKATEYWYEIELNDNQTIIGYDENGPKKLMLYPEGAESNDTN